MAEKHDPPKQLLLELENKNSFTVVIKDDGKKPAVSRKKPTVSTRSMTVKIPGGQKSTTAKKSPPNPAKKKTGGEQGKSHRTVSVHREAEQPNPHVVYTHAPATKKVISSRPKIELPKIGKRKGYRTPLSRMILIPLIIASLLVCLLVVLYYVLQYSQAQLETVQESAVVREQQTVAVTISKGMTARSVSLLLEQAGVIGDSQSFLAYLVEEDLSTVIKTGTYLVDKDMDYQELSAMLTAPARLVTLTVGDGFTLKTVDAYLSNRLSLEKGAFITAAQDLAFAYDLSFAEGWMLSGTYAVNRNNVEKTLALAMYEAMLHEVARYVDSPLLERYSIEELLIVASMIQAETQEADQMPGISSVIHNRLKAGEPLGIDATTRYELDDWVNPIPKEALEQKSPYNTRRKVGLPPSGICCPGKDALQAAFYPAETDYFYYLHDTDKQIHYAKTYDEHKQNITLYR